VRMWFESIASLIWEGQLFTAEGKMLKLNLPFKAGRYQ